MTEQGTCSQCRTFAQLETVVDFTGWILDLCHRCAVAACDHLAAGAAP